MHGQPVHKGGDPLMFGIKPALARRHAIPVLLLQLCQLGTSKLPWCGSTGHQAPLPGSAGTGKVCDASSIFALPQAYLHFKAPP